MGGGGVGGTRQPGLLAPQRVGGGPSVKLCGHRLRMARGRRVPPPQSCHAGSSRHSPPRPISRLLASLAQSVATLAFSASSQSERISIRFFFSLYKYIRRHFSILLITQPHMVTMLHKVLLEINNLSISSDLIQTNLI